MKFEDILAGLNINTGGGAYIGGDASIGRDFIGRDKVVNVFVVNLVLQKKSWQV